MFNARQSTSSLFFKLPDTFRTFKDDKLLTYGIVLVVCGVLSIINATVAIFMRATKEYYLKDYTNTHWITSVSLVAGFSAILSQKLRMNYFLFASICLNSIGAMVFVGAFVFDCLNIREIRQIGKTLKSESLQSRIAPLVTYATFDILTSMISFAMCCGVLYESKKIAVR